MTTTYEYFVSFWHSSRKGEGFGCTAILRTAPVRTGKDVFEMIDTIKAGLGLVASETVAILNFQLLSATEEPQS